MSGVSPQGQWLPDGPGECWGCEEEEEEGKSEDCQSKQSWGRGKFFVTPRSTDPLHWVHQPAGCLGQQGVPCVLPLRFLPALPWGLP